MLRPARAVPLALISAMFLLVFVSRAPAGARCSSTAVIAPVKAALQQAQAAQAAQGKTLADGRRGYELLQAARASIDTAAQNISTACAGDDFDAMNAQEALSVLRAWSFSLTADRALFLAGLRADCSQGLHVIAGRAVANGWGYLNRVYRERPVPDGFGYARSLLKQNARVLGLRLPPQGDDAALDAFQRENHLTAGIAAASLPPLCTRY
jgi:hypothetical protein